MLRTLFFACCLVTPVLVSAQVGHDPLKSPYRDLEYRQELSFIGGRFDAAIDPARVAPTGGPMLGAHYELRLGGPVYFTARVVGVLSNRSVIDPKLEVVNRIKGDRSVPMVMADAGFSLNLTGFKSWHGIVPVLGGGLGLGAGFEKLDVGGYRFGYPFLVTARPGIKVARRGLWQGRIDATNYFYRIRYPDTYFVKTGADAPVLEPGSARSYWKRNLGVTAGITRTFGR